MKKRPARPIACACASSCFRTEASTVQAHHTRPSEILLQRFSRQTSTSSSLRDTYQNWRETARHNKQHRQERSDVLDHLVAAYRQYHTASGGYFATPSLSGEATPYARTALRMATRTSHRLGL